MTLNLSFLK